MNNKIYQITDDFELKELILLSESELQYEVIDKGYCYKASKDYFIKEKKSAIKELKFLINSEIIKLNFYRHGVQKKIENLSDKFKKLS